MSAAASVIHVHPTGPLVSLVGNPNCGKTALFNLLTGSRQKVGNYAGVTVERKEGRLLTATGTPVRILDLPGTYSLYPRSLDERVTVDVLNGRAVGEKRPDLVVCVVDASQMRRGLRLLLPVMRQGLPVVLAVNMVDVIERRGVQVDTAALSTSLGVPVVSTVAVRSGGEGALTQLLANRSLWPSIPVDQPSPEHDEARVQAALEAAGLQDVMPDLMSDRVDSIFLHPVWGMLILIAVLFAIFQAVFIGAKWPMTQLQSLTAWASQAVAGLLPADGVGGFVSGLLTEGLIAGVGGVLVFLPQILILFFFILVLEESGYLPRAAYLLDRLMGGVGLSGRSFIPLLSSFSCAIPGILATRTISDIRDRYVTILIAPLMTCSARLPVYALLIAAFVPDDTVWGGISRQGLVLLGLYAAGIAAAMAVAWVIRRFGSGGESRVLMMELPSYHWPSVRHVGLGLWQRAQIFLRRVGGVILTLTLILWLLTTVPGPSGGLAEGASAVEASLAGWVGRGMAPLFAPLGFNWQISIALVPGMAAREVLVSSLATVYAVAGGDDVGASLAPVLSAAWEPATAYALLAWFVFAPQCLSTLAAVRRETGGWRLPAIIVIYLFGLAYLFAWLTHRVALALS